MQTAMTDSTAARVPALVRSSRLGERQVTTDAPVGDVIDLTLQGMEVEIVLGFRPGIDRLVLPAEQTLGFHQEDGDVVIRRGTGALIVLQGVSIAEMAAGVEA